MAALASHIFLRFCFGSDEKAPVVSSSTSVDVMSVAEPTDLLSSLLTTSLGYNATYNLFLLETMIDTTLDAPR